MKSGFPSPPTNQALAGVRRWEWAGVAALTLIALGILTSLAARTGVTVDEPAHLLSARLYWQGGVTLQPGDVPPLIKIVGGWVPALLDLPLPKSDHPSWRRGRERDVALEMMAGMTGAQIRRIFFWSRLPFFVFPVGCMLLLWWWGRQLFSPGVGWLIAAAFALSPTVLGHGVLINNDLAAAFGYLLFWYRAWVYWKAPSQRRAVWLAVALLMAITAKFSMLILAPLALALLLIRQLSLPQFSWRALTASLALTAAILLCGINLAWQAPPLTAGEIHTWRRDPAIPKVVSGLVRHTSMIPTSAGFRGGAMSIVHSNRDAGSTDFLGELRSGGDLLYFMTVLMLKMRASALALILAGLGLCAFDLFGRRIGWRDLLWLAPPFLYLLLASISGPPSGIRLVMPALPFLFLIGGRMLAWRGVWELGPAVPVILVCWLGTSTLFAYPHYISFFNRWVGGPENGLSYFSDSNVDWGQDLPELARIVKERHLEPIRLAYFGADNPLAYMNGQTVQQMATPQDDELAPGPLEPEPGYYAISATLLAGQSLAPKYRDYYADFRTRRPLAKAGYSIYVYQVK